MKLNDKVQKDILSIADLDFSLGDPLLGRLGNTPPFYFALFAYAVALFSSFIIAALAGTLFPGGEFAGQALLNDWFYLLTETISILVLWTYYGWISRAPKEALVILAAAGTLAPEQTQLQKAAKILSNCWLTWVMLLSALVGAWVYYRQYADPTPALWYNASGGYLLFRTLLVILPVAFATTSILIRIVVNVNVIKTLLKGVKVNPLHPDKAGGLAPLGQYALRTSYLIALAGIVVAFSLKVVIASQNSASAAFLVLGIIVYVIAAPYSFFAPLGTAREAMKIAKTKALLEISHQFDSDYTSAFGKLDGDAQPLKATLEKIEQLQKMQSITESFPIWPFDAETLRKFFVAISSPIIAGLISLVTEKVLDFVKGLVQ